MTRKQFLVAISLVSVLVIGVVVGFFAFSNRAPAENNVVRSIELSPDELRDIEIFSSTFLQEASTFGINMDTLTTDTVSQRMEDIANDNGGTSWTKRTEVAGRVVSQYVDLSGGFPYRADRIANADYTDGTETASFRPGKMDVKADKKADYVYTNRDEPVLLAKVSFSGTSVLSHFSQSPDATHDHGPSDQENHDADFTPWDIREQDVSVKGTLTLSRETEGGDWRVRELKIDQGSFAMAFWGPEEFTTSYPGVELAGTVVRTVDFPNEKEGSNGSE